MEHTAPDPALFSHVRVVIGMVVSLSVARILTGIALFIQHPGKLKAYPVHLAWAAFLLLFLLHFWWWEFRLQALTTIGFGVYLFLICYCCLFFLLAVFLFPTTLDDYAGYEDYFYSRRRWFFGAFALVFAVDLLDTALKGVDGEPPLPHRFRRLRHPLPAKLDFPGLRRPRIALSP
jgi:hypothetical protein